MSYFPRAIWHTDGGWGQNLAPEGVCGLNRDQGNCLTVATPAYGILSSSTTSLALHVIIC